MASISKRDNGSWLARYRPVAGGAQKTRSFARKVDAKRWLDETTASIVTSQYIDPQAAKTTVRQYAKAWQAAQVTRASTRNNVDVALRLHVLPTIGDRSMGSVRSSDMQALVKMLSATLSPGRSGRRTRSRAGCSARLWMTGYSRSPLAIGSVFPTMIGRRLSSRLSSRSRPWPVECPRDTGRLSSCSPGPVCA